MSAPAVAVTFLLDGDEYVKRGAVSRYAGSPDEWAAEFRSVGGVSASVEPAWRTGAPDLTFTVTGSAAAVALVAASAPLKAAKGVISSRDLGKTS